MSYVLSISSQKFSIFPYVILLSLKIILKYSEYTKAGYQIQAHFVNTTTQVAVHGINYKETSVIFLISGVGLWVLRPLTGLLYQPRMIGDGVIVEKLVE
jgi:hypothetical protein